MPTWAPKAVEKLPRIDRWSVISVEVILSMPMPPYSSGISTEAKPSSPALRISACSTPGCLASMAAALGKISSRANCAAVVATCRCSSFRSSGVKISAGVRVSSRKLPPAAATMGEGLNADIGKYLQLTQNSIPRGRQRATSMANSPLAGALFTFSPASPGTPAGSEADPHGRARSCRQSLPPAIHPLFPRSASASSSVPT